MSNENGSGGGSDNGSSGQSNGGNNESQEAPNQSPFTNPGQMTTRSEEPIKPFIIKRDDKSPGA